MGLFKRGTVWWIRFTYNGRQIKRSTETRDRRIAEKIHHKVMAEIAEGKWLDKLEGDNRTFEELADKYVNEHCRNNKKDWKKYAERLKVHLIPFFGSTIVTEVSPKFISAYKQYRYKKGVKGATINRELTVMKHMYSVAIKEWEWCRDNTVKRVSMEKEGQPKDRWLTASEEERLLKATPAWLSEIVTFALNTGMRQGEILSLK